MDTKSPDKSVKAPTKLPPALTERSLGYFSQSSYATQYGVAAFLAIALVLLIAAILLYLMVSIHGLILTALYLAIMIYLGCQLKKIHNTFDLATSSRALKDYRKEAYYAYLSKGNSGYRHFIATVAEVRLLFIRNRTTPSMHFRDDPSNYLHHFDTRFNRQIDYSQRVLELANKMHILALQVDDLSILDRFNRECLLPARDSLVATQEIVQARIDGSPLKEEANIHLQALESNIEQKLAEGESQFDIHDRRRMLASTTKSSMILRQLGQDPDFDRELEEAEEQAKALKAN